MINWKCTAEEGSLIGQIAKRGKAMADKVGIPYRQDILYMDINACHSNGTPLKLAELLAADDFNFAHDVFGICQNINRTTGKLENCFLPRYAA